MKIVYCIRNTYAGGGMARVLANKANYLADRMGYDVSVITLDQQVPKHFYDFSPAIKHYDLGIKYRTVVKISCLSPIVTFMKSREHKQKLEKLLKELKPDITVSMFDSEARFLYKIKDGSKKILEIHFSKWGRQQHNKSVGGKFIDILKAIYDEWVVSKYDAFVVLTEEDKKCWKFTKNISVIYNALAFKTERAAQLDNKVVISVGKLTDQKGYDILIDIWRLVDTRHPDWHLLIVGEGEQQEMLEEKIHKNLLDDRVQIIPFTKEIALKYLDSSIYVMSSRYEGFGMVLIEAMACGLPAISFLCKSGPSEIIREDQDGFLIPVGDINKFADRICQLIEQEDKRKEMGRQAAINIQRFSEDEIMRQWCDLFEQISGNKK